MEQKPTNNKLQIFLGGSCNPTTWRQSVAIPYLELNGITYYNPQVDNWSPEVVHIERNAKQNAQVLLFVIDRQTRSTVSIVESAFIAGENENLVLVIYPFEYDVICCMDNSREIFSHYESTTSKSLKTFIKSTKFHPLTSSSTSSSSVVSHSSCASLKSDCSTQQRDSRSLVQASTTSCSTSTTLAASSKIVSKVFDRGSSSQLDEKDLKTTREEAQRTSGILKISGEVISAGEFLELQKARQLLQCLMVRRRVPMFSDILKALKHVTNCLVQCNSISGHIVLKKSDELITKTHSDEIEQLDRDKLKDVYFSLDGDDQTSIASAVISILNEKGLSYNFMPVNNVLRATKGSESDVGSESTTTSEQTRPCELEQAEQSDQLIQSWQRSMHQANLGTPACTSRVSSLGDLTNLNSNDRTKSAIEREICSIRGSRVVLFVISNKCRGLSIMVLASHFMALFKESVVLCVQYLEEPCSIEGESLSRNAIADYNRGRVYLCDYALKSQVPVFSNIRDAVECCSERCGRPIGSCQAMAAAARRR